MSSLQELPVLESERRRSPLGTQAALDDTDRALVNRLQHGLPLVSNPWAAVAAELGLDADGVLARVQRLLATGVLTRFGPMFQIERAGGRFTLAAMAVPEARFDEVAAIVNAFPEVAHNYQRSHHLNMWFVVATETPAQCADVLGRIAEATGLAVLDMPKQREFHVLLHFEV